MPRLARLDAPGVLHHVMGRGIEKNNIFFNNKDRNDFINRLSELVEESAIEIYAWALMPNHFHLLLKTKNRPLSSSMRKILTGYVINVNRRHKRYGHLFQNRYKSIVCQEGVYLMELVRYIHLNLLRGGVVKDMNGLNSSPWSGHSALLGKVVQGSSVSNDAGKMISKWWRKIENKFPSVQNDAFVVMPNHVHVIVVIHDVETPHVASLQQPPKRKFGPLQPGSLSKIIQAYKAAVTRQARRNGYADFAWQERFYDHIIRDDKSLENIRAYIVGNPVKWDEDEYFLGI